MPLILSGNVASATAATGYNVDNSCRFNDDDSAELTKTFGSAGNQKKWTFSFWVKRGLISGSTTFSILEAGHGSTPWFVFTFNNDILQVAATAGTAAGWSTAALFRDLSAWYHVVLAVDTTSSTSSISNGSTDRFRIFVNNVQQTLSGGSVPSQNADLQWNGTAGQHMFGASYAGQFFDGYVAEVAFIDGSALNPSSFGEYDEDSPTIWKPKDLSDLTFGTNGYWLDFEDSSALGNDVSGNNNDWTTANLAAIDQTSDTCTNNFATLNPLDNVQSDATYSEGNCKWATSTNGHYFWGRSTIGVSASKWYMEFKATSIPEHGYFGICVDAPEDNTTFLTNGGRNDHVEYGYKTSDGNSYNNTGDSSYGDTYDDGDIIGVALDLTNNKLYFSKNGTWQNSGDPTSGATGTGAISITAAASNGFGEYFFCCADGTAGTSGTFEANFGNPTFSISSGNADANGYGNFEYSVPSGYLSLCTKNLGSDGG